MVDTLVHAGGIKGAFIHYGPIPKAHFISTQTALSELSPCHTKKSKIADFCWGLVIKKANLCGTVSKSC